MARAVRGAELVGLDLETIGLDPRRSEIRLTQIATSAETFVIDCQRRGKEELLSVVEGLGASPVVAHNAAFEWSFIYYHFGVELTNITDTMLLAQLLAAGNMGVERGLGPVAKDVIGVELDKDQQTSDWSTPVLTKAQLDYAAFDAQVLIPLVERLGAEVAGAGSSALPR